MQTSYLYSSYSGLSISTPVVTSQFLSSQIKVIYVFSLFYPHSYQSIPLLSETPGNNLVLLKYATTYATADRGTAHELRPRLFPHFVVNSLPLWSNSAPFQVTPLPLCTFLTQSLTSPRVTLGGRDHNVVTIRLIIDHILGKYRAQSFMIHSQKLNTTFCMSVPSTRDITWLGTYSTKSPNSSKTNCELSTLPLRQHQVIYKQPVSPIQLFPFLSSLLFSLLQCI